MIQSLTIIYVIGLIITPVILVLVNQFWLEPRSNWSERVVTWMSILWPATAVVLAIVFVLACIIRLSAFICETPKSNWGCRLKRLIFTSADAVMEPIVNRIVK